VARGMYRTVKRELGECVRIAWGAEPESFLTRDTYEANRHHPPFDDLPTEEEFKRDLREAWGKEY
jgi:hypothetical protein